jgi:hypothetical protein
MLNANAKKWIEALRSGEYKQTDNALHKGDGYCCLGVACEVYAHENGGTWCLPAGRADSDELGATFNPPAGGYPMFNIGRSDFLPSPVKEWLGLTSENGDFSPGKVGFLSCSLSRLNDSNWSFSDIADIIEIKQDILFKDA